MATALNLVQNVALLSFVQELVKPWEETDAFEQGIVDENGKPLKKVREFTTMDEKNAYTPAHRFIYNIKRLIEKVPAGRTKLGSLTAALLLIKEECSEEEFKELLERFEIDESLFQEEEIKMIKEEAEKIKEEVSSTPTNNTGDGNMAGVSPGETPPGPSTFAGHRCFDVSTGTFLKCRNGKYRYHRWDQYVGEEDNSEEIRSYGKENPGKPIIVKDKQSGAMLYLRK